MIITGTWFMASHAWIALEAIDPKANVFRRYILDVSEDLFGHWIVTRQWGRIGSSSQRVATSFASKEDSERFVRMLLQRRRTAPKRIGVPYKLTAQSTDADTLLQY
ncbi:MAG: WGR domain-containing protein [Pseudomonadota bacterium]